MEELIKYGEKMVRSGLVHSHFGNMSKRIGSDMLISTTGSMLDELEGEIVRVPIEGESSLDLISSSELVVHREIYKKTSALALLHGHSPFAVILSLLTTGDVIKTDESESQYLLHEIPVIDGGVGSKEMAKNAAESLKEHKGCIVRGHGVIARGSTVDEAYVVLCSVEHACKVKYFVDIAKKLGSS